VNLLLDTHAFLWWVGGQPLEPSAMERIADPDTLVAVSAASAWEIAIKRSIGKLRFDADVTIEVAANGFEALAIGLDHATQAGELPSHHRDPFDRMLIAQARVEGLTLVTRDRRLAAYEVEILPC
jgi:PIN domain nuclease of toxin-antitoxin system